MPLTVLFLGVLTHTHTHTHTQKDSKIKYHHFPKNKAYRDQWVHACCRADTINTKYAIVCSIHFKPEDYKDDLKLRLLGIGSPKHHRLLKEDAVPTLFPPNGE